MQAGIEMGRDMRAVLIDITPYTFGTSTLGQLYGQPYAHQFVPIIRRNTKHPATRTEAFYTVFAEQEAVEIKVYQGEDPDALKNVEIGSFHFADLNRRTSAYDEGLLFTCHLDLDGLPKVHAVERGTGQEIHGIVENALGRSTGEQLAASKQRIEGLWHREAQAGESATAKPAAEAPAAGARGPVQDILERAERALDTAPDEDREEIASLIERQRAALRESRDEDAAAITQNLDEILFYLE